MAVASIVGLFLILLLGYAPSDDKQPSYADKRGESGYDVAGRVASAAVAG